jgi:LysR family transcriptional regulator, glycine cleavage system transcriptional activator
VADALRDGRLLRLSPVSMQEEESSYSYWLAFPPSMRDWPPLRALQQWLFDELALSQRELPGATETKPAGRSKNRNRVPSAAPTKRRVR